METSDAMRVSVVSKDVDILGHSITPKLCSKCWQLSSMIKSARITVVFQIYLSCAIVKAKLLSSKREFHALA